MRLDIVNDMSFVDCISFLRYFALCTADYSRLEMQWDSNGDYSTYQRTCFHQCSKVEEFPQLTWQRGNLHGWC